MSTQPRGAGLRIGSVGGAPVRIGPTWLVLAAVVVLSVGSDLRGSSQAPGAVAYLVALGYALVLLASVLLHEVAHALTARRVGLRVSAVVADLWGGHTSFEGHGLRPGTSALVAAAGPATNLLVGGVALLARAALEPGIPRLLCYAAAVANLALGVFNLLPGLPLDGGQLLEALLWRLTGTRETATRVAAWCGRAVAALVATWFVLVPLTLGHPLSTTALWSLLVAWFLWRGASQALARGRVVARFEGRTVDELVHPLPTVDAGELLGRVQDRRLAIVLDGGRPVGLLTSAAVDAVPVDRRAATPVSAVVAREPDGWVIDATGTALLPVVQDLAVRRLPYAVVRRDGALLGLLQGGDVQRLLDH